MGKTFVKRTIRQLGVECADVEDIFQDVMMAAFRGLTRLNEWPFSDAPPLAELQSLAPLQAWLFGITWRLVGQYRSRAHRRHEVALGLPGERSFPPDDEVLDGEEVVAAEERAQILDALLARMDPQRRVVLVLHDMLEMPMKEIARQLGSKQNTAQNRLRLGRQDFRAAVKRLPAELRRALRLGDLPFAGEATTRHRPVKPQRRGRG